MTRSRTAILAALLSLAFPARRTPAQDAPPPSRGQVIFSRDADSAVAPQPGTPQQPAALGQEDPLGVTDAERSAITFTSYDLDAHLTPASSTIAVRAAVTVRNDSASALNRIILQLSSTLRWDAVSGGEPLRVSSRLILTDADHTGSMNEAVITLPQPLGPGASVTLTALYSGTIAISTERLERAGAPPEQARSSDWDVVGADGTYVRGFGHVLWYPVCAPAMFFREGDRLFNAIGATRLRQSRTPVRLRVAVEYQGEPPDAAYFAGRRESLKAISDNPDTPIAEGAGIATAIFAPEPLGFRTLDLFLTARPPVLAGTAGDADMVSILTSHDSAAAAYSAAATAVEPLLNTWYGAHAQRPLFVIDHAGQPFEDDTLLIHSLAPEDPVTLQAELAHSLTHAWIHSSQPWIDEGLAEFSRLLWLERTRGRDAALAALQESARTLAHAEAALPTHSENEVAPSSSSSSSDEAHGQGQSLTNATSEVFYRTKAAAVWWMLRGITGDQTLQQALQAYRSDEHLEQDARGLERTLEKVSHKDLRWFFDDWVDHDHGLPRLSIANVTPSELKGRTGLTDGWLVAVEVRNDGDAAAEVPVTVRSVGASQTQRLRIGAHSSAVTRVVFAGTPDEVLVNDGSVPESGATTHTRQLKLAH